MVTALHVVALSLYLAVAGVLALSLLGGGRGVPPLAGRAAVGAVAAHGTGLFAYVATFGELPLVGLAPSLSVLAFLIGLFLLVVAWPGEVRPLGVVLSPVVALLLGVALLRGIAPTGALAAFRGVWLYFHTTLAFLGFAGLVLAFAAGLIYLLQFRELKGKRLGRVFRFFPSLDVLDRVTWYALRFGFSALTLGLVVGWGWAARFAEPWELREPKLIWGVLTWLVFVCALMVRATGVGRRRRGAVVTVLGFLLAVVVYLVLRVTEVAGGGFLCGGGTLASPGRVSLQRRLE
jgi:ABC-type uncharacterized transport system permease subunit